MSGIDIKGEGNYEEQAAAGQTESTGVAMHTCSECKGQKEESEIMGTHTDKNDRVTRWICHDCNGTKARLNRLRRAGAVINIDAEDRADFFAGACKLKSGQELAAYAKKRDLQREETKHHQETLLTGTFMCHADLEQLPRFRSNPESLQRLMQKTEKKVCELTDETLYFLPTHQMSSSRASTSSRSSELSAEGEKKLNTERAKGDKPKHANSQKSKTPGVPKLTAGLQKKVTSALTDISQKLVRMAEMGMIASAKEAEGLVPMHYLKKSEALDQELGRVQEALQTAEREGDKETAEKILKNCTETLKQHNWMLDRLTSLANAIGTESNHSHLAVLTGPNHEKNNMF